MPRTSICVFRDAGGDVPLMDWLETLRKREPVAFAKALSHIRDLESMGYELRRPAVDNLGDDIWELRWRVVKVQYRILFFYSGRNAVVLSHGITKTDKIPPSDISLAKRRKKLVAANFSKFTADFYV